MTIYYSNQMSQLTGNTGGAVQSLPPVTQISAKERVFVANVALAAQASGSVIVLGRIPLFAAITAVTLFTDTSLGSATLEIGDANTPALLMAAATLTTVNAPVSVGLADQIGAPITAGYDGTTGNQVTYASPGEGGALYDDVIATTGAAALPGAGNLTVLIKYVID